MGESSIKIGGMSIQYGITPVREVLNKGYTISDFEQIIEEPTLAVCNLNKNNKTIAILSFYNLKNKITIDQLADIPIDLVLPHSIKKSSKKNAKNGALSPKQALKSRIVLTCLIHLIAIAIFMCVYAFPALFAWVQKTEFRAMSGSAPIGMVLLVLPALMITFLWGGLEVKENPIITKILLSLWLIINVMISLTYLVLIDNMFTHRIF